MPTTSNFGWTTPADTDLVKDGAAAIRTLGNGIDTSFLDLKGGTTDQVLAKNSNTDLDFKWVAADDVDAIQKSLIDAEGDLIVGDAADAVQRLAIGSNGNVLTVDTTVDGKIKWAAPAAGGAYTQIATASLSSTTTTISSIPSTYTDLILIINDFSSALDFDFGIRFNNDSGSNYHYVFLRDKAGTAATGTGGATATSIKPTLGASLTAGSTDNTMYFQIQNYANTTAYKTTSANIRFNSSANEEHTGTIDGSWYSASAINEINIVNLTTTWNAGTYFLLGVK